LSYNIQIIKKNQYKTSEWSGGTTTELYIYPIDSLYSKRDFKWRLSSATIEVEYSKFTSLPGIERLIMVIQGELVLQHKGHHSATLKALEQDSFSGEWSTTSFGKVIDFNLMLAKGYTGKLESLLFYNGEAKDILLNNNDERFSEIVEAFYIVEGSIEIVRGINEKISLNKGDLALVTRIGKETTLEFKINSRCQEETKIIKASIFYC